MTALLYAAFAVLSAIGELAMTGVLAFCFIVALMLVGLWLA